MNPYDIGDNALLTAVFRNEITGVLTDPTVVTLTVRPPGAAPVTYTYGVGTVIVRESVGLFNATIPLSTSLKWRYKWFGTGALVAAEEGVLFVRRSGV